MGEVVGFINGEGDDGEMLVRLTPAQWLVVLDRLGPIWADREIAERISTQTGLVVKPEGTQTIYLPPGARLVDMDPYEEER